MLGVSKKGFGGGQPSWDHASRDTQNAQFCISSGLYRYHNSDEGITVLPDITRIPLPEFAGDAMSASPCLPAQAPPEQSHRSPTHPRSVVPPISRERRVPRACGAKPPPDAASWSRLRVPGHSPRRPSHASAAGVFLLLFLVFLLLPAKDRGPDPVHDPACPRRLGGFPGTWSAGDDCIYRGGYGVMC